MLHVVHTVTLHDANGRLWDEAPPPGTDGLVTVLQTPSSNVSASVRALGFACAAFDARAQLLAAITSKGDVYAFQLRQNRYSRLDKAGHAATAAAFSTAALRQLFVGFAVRRMHACMGRVHAGNECRPHGTPAPRGPKRACVPAIYGHPLCSAALGLLHPLLRRGQGGASRHPQGAPMASSRMLHTCTATQMQSIPTPRMAEIPTRPSSMCSPVLHLSVRNGCDEMLSVAADGIILWDTKVGGRKIIESPWVPGCQGGLNGCRGATVPGRDSQLRAGVPSGRDTVRDSLAPAFGNKKVLVLLDALVQVT